MSAFIGGTIEVIHFREPWTRKSRNNHIVECLITTLQR